MKNISNIRNCYGCGVCASICSKEAIRIELNDDGFYEPVVNDDICVNCGLCLSVCGYSHTELANLPASIKSWAAWSNDKRVQRKASSGGIGFEIAKQGIERGYKLCACRYNAEDGRAEHYIASTVEAAVQSIGSKYIQSYTVDGFKAIDRAEKYIVTGTPCQMDSFRRYIKKFKVEDNFILVDFYCHCVPSMWAWKKYLQYVEQYTGKVTYASWRNKFTGWHDSWAMSLDGEKQGEKVNWHDSYNLLIKEKKGFFNSRLSQGDPFYYLFLGDLCFNPACERNCKFKYTSSSADIRIGDLWGQVYKDNDEGVSALLAFTSRGRLFVESLKDVTLVEHPVEIVAEGQMRNNVRKAIGYTLIMRFLKNKATRISSYSWILLKCFVNIARKLRYKFKI